MTRTQRQMPGLMRLLRSGLAGLACVALPAAGATPEDVLILKDGRLLDGLELERTDEGVRVILEAGEILVPSERVQEVLLAGTSDWQPETEEEHSPRRKKEVFIGIGREPSIVCV